MTQIHFKDIAKIRKVHKGKKIVFCSGCFDLTHAGHVLFFEDCKRQGDILVVGIGPDKIIKKEKGGKRPILNEHIRLKMVASLKAVDWAFIMTPIPKPGQHPLAPLRKVITKLNPDVYVINDDASYRQYRKAMTEDACIKLVVLKRTCPSKFKKISTTKIIEKIRGLRGEN